MCVVVDTVCGTCKGAVAKMDCLVASIMNLQICPSRQEGSKY